MILGIGVDIIHLPRIKTLISKRGIEGFARRVLSPIEYQNFLINIQRISGSSSTTTPTSLPWMVH
ncbi:unnamed protein product [Cunninghamella echinulata]